MSVTEEYKKFVIERAMEIDHKEGVNPEDWKRVKENLLVLVDFVINECDKLNLPLKITSIIRPKIPGVSKTDTHAEGRAFDVSVIGWSQSDIRTMCLEVNRKLNIGAYSTKDGLEREAVYEDGFTAGKGAHIHFQVRR
jgi:hypothetical protein